MQINRIDLNLYLVLDAIYREGSITSAAKVLNLTQPAVSHALNRLRQKLNDPLFVRQGRNMIPSTHTQQIIVDIQNALQLLESSFIQEKQFDLASLQKTFNIAMKDSVEPVLMGFLIPQIRNQAPGIRLNSVQVNRRDLEKELISGSIDLALDILIPISDQIKYTPSGHDQMAVVVSPDHPRIKDSLPLESYLSEEHVLVSSRRRGPAFEDYELSRLGYRRNVRYRCQSYEGGSAIVRNSDLLLTMPETHARKINLSMQNLIYPMPLVMQPLDSYLYWHRTMDNDPAHLWFRNKLLEFHRRI